MTENEALKKHKEDCKRCNDKACERNHKCLQKKDIEVYEKLIAFEAIGTIEEFKALKEKNVIITQSDIDTFKVYIEDCMDAVAFGNTDWNHSLALALKCMELHKT